MSALIDMTTAVFNLLKSKTSYEYTFDDYPTGAVPPAPWVTDISGYSFAHVVDNPHQGAAGKALKLWGVDYPAAAYFNFVPLGPQGALDCYALVGGASAFPNSRTIYVLDGASPLIRIEYSNDSHIYATDGGVRRDLGAYTLDAWKHLIVFWNCITGTYYLFLDGVRWPAAATYAFMAVGGVNANRFMVDNSDGSNNTLCVDTIKVHSFSAGWTENWDAYGAGAPPPAPWFTATAGGATVLVSAAQFVSAPQSIDLTSAGGGDFAQAWRICAWGPADRFMRASISLRPATNTNGIYGRRFSISPGGGPGGPQIAEVSFHNDGHIWLNRVVDLGAYAANNWYTLKLFLDKTLRLVWVEYGSTLFGPYAYAAGGDASIFILEANNSANALFSDDLVVDFYNIIEDEDFDAYTSNQDPPAPWTSSYTRESSVLVVDAPHQGTAGKSAELANGETYTHSHLKVNYSLTGTVTFYSYLMARDNVGGAYGRRMILYNIAGAEENVVVAMHSDGHIWALDGVTWRDLGAYALDTWYLVKLVINTSARTYYLELDGVRWPATPGTYAFAGAATPDQIRYASEVAHTRFNIDTVRYGLMTTLPSLQFFTEFPRLNPNGVFAVLKMITDERKWGYTGANGSGKKLIAHKLAFKFYVFVPAFEGASDIYSSKSEVELIDTILDTYCELLMTYRHTLTNFSHFMVGTVSEVGFSPEVHYLYRSVNLNWRFYEEV